jgi:acetolactate decarboxylase
MFLRKKVCILIIFCLLCVIFAVTACSTKIKCPENADAQISQRETLVQISTIDALLSGVYDGVVTFETLKKFGDFGIGTFEGLDGEMVAVDGNFYQVKADGVAYPVSESMKTPFASVTFFDTDREVQLPEGMNYGSSAEFLDRILPTKNIFYAIKIEGTFSYIKTRSVPRQKKPYPPLVELTKNQPTFELINVDGAIIGFRCPLYVSGVNVPGYHLHFLTRNRDAGGHVLEFKLKQAVASIDNTSQFLMILPGEDSDFYKARLTEGTQDDLEKSEK